MQQRYHSGCVKPEKVRDMLSEIKEESGASIIEKKLIKHIEVSHDDGITIQVELNKDFRKLKQLI